MLSCVSTTDRLIRAAEYQTPGADGVQPIAMLDYNEWIMLSYADCHTLRAEASWAPSNYADSAASCFARPVYAR